MSLSQRLRTALNLSGCSTGYYGRFDSTGRMRVTKTHVRLNGEHGPLCGARVHPEQGFHFNAPGVHREYLECRSCKSMANSSETLKVLSN